jgi:branched-subunit amino acid transport protein
VNALCVLAAAGLLTWIMRVGFIKITPAQNFPVAIRGALEATGPAAMAALIVSDLVQASSEGVAAVVAASVATIVAAAVMWRLRSIVLVVVVGMATYWATLLVL